MIYDAEKQRPRGKPHIQICSHSVPLKSCAWQTIPTQREENMRLSHVYLWCWLWRLTPLVARQISSIHDAQTFASKHAARLSFLRICWWLEASVQRYAACLPLFRWHPVSIHWKLTVAMIQFSCLKLIDITEGFKRNGIFFSNHFLYNTFAQSMTFHWP